MTHGTPPGPTAATEPAAPTAAGWADVLDSALQDFRRRLDETTSTAHRGPAAPVVEVPTDDGPVVPREALLDERERELERREREVEQQLDKAAKALVAAAKQLADAKVTSARLVAESEERIAARELEVDTRARQRLEDAGALADRIIGSAEEAAERSRRDLRRVASAILRYVDQQTPADEPVVELRDPAPSRR